MSKTEVDATAEEITRYLEQHPDAADSAEGIQRWWLGSEENQVSFETVYRALCLLERRGVVRADMVEGGPVIYRRVRHRKRRSG